MKKKYLIFGATGSIGSNLANQLYNEKKDCHLIGRNEEELKKDGKDDQSDSTDDDTTDSDQSD